MMPKRSPSLIKCLLLMLALINLVHGKAMNSTKFTENRTKQRRDVCPTSNASKFPDSLRVQMHNIQTNQSNTRLSDVSNRSISPWEYSINEDPNRVPREISEAKCRYFACVHVSGQGLEYSMNSVPIQQEILVLRRKQKGCQQTYWLEKQMVTVGCTCAFPTILPIST